MDEDDLEPRTSRIPVVRNLEPLSVAELQAYIDELKSEIARAEQAIAAKRSLRSGADALFRK